MRKELFFICLLSVIFVNGACGNTTYEVRFYPDSISPTFRPGGGGDIPLGDGANSVADSGKPGGGAGEMSPGSGILLTGHDQFALMFTFGGKAESSPETDAKASANVTSPGAVAGTGGNDGVDGKEPEEAPKLPVTE